jgi:two-component system, NarL family, response regulator NreC
MTDSLRLADGSRGPDLVAEAPVITVVIVDPHDEMRTGLRRVLDAEESIEVIAAARDLASIERQLDAMRPDVLALDLSVSGRSSAGTIARLRERAPHTQIVALTVDDSPALAEHALISGACGYVLKERADRDLPEAVRAAVRRERYVSPYVGLPRRRLTTAGK